jgi:hypothetical protein
MADEGSSHAWVPETVESIVGPFLAAHPEHRTPVRQALDLIAADPYAVPLRPYRGHDAPHATYVHAIARTRVEIVFTILRDTPPRLALFQVLDWEDLPLVAPPAE